MPFMLVLLKFPLKGSENTRKVKLHHHGMQGSIPILRILVKHPHKTTTSPAEGQERGETGALLLDFLCQHQVTLTQPHPTPV